MFKVVLTPLLDIGSNTLLTSESDGIMTLPSRSVSEIVIDLMLTKLLPGSVCTSTLISPSAGDVFEKTP